MSEGRLEGKNVVVSGETINQEMANIAREITNKTFQLFIQPPSQKSSGQNYLELKW